MNVTKAGILFIESHDPISRIKMAISNQKFSTIGFYSSSSIPGDPEIQVFLFDILDGLDKTFSPPIWTKLNHPSDHFEKNQSKRNAIATLTPLSYQHLKLLPIRKMMRKELLPILIDGKIDQTLTEKIKIAFRNFILNLETFNSNLYPNSQINLLQILFDYLNQVLSKSIHQAYQERFGEYLGTHYFNSNKQNSNKQNSDKQRHQSNNQLIETLGSHHFGSLVEIFTKEEDKTNFNTPIYRSYLKQIFEDLSRRILLDSNFLENVIQLFQKEENPENIDLSKVNLPPSSSNRNDQIESLALLDHQINNIWDAINTQMCPVVNLYQLIKISDRLKESQGIEGNTKILLNHQILKQFSKENNKEDKDERGENNKRDKDERGENNKDERGENNKDERGENNKDERGENNKDEREKIMSFPGLISIDPEEDYTNRKKIELRYKRGNQTIITIPLRNADLTQFSQDELLEISIILDQSDDSIYDQLKNEVAERISQIREFIHNR